MKKLAIKEKRNQRADNNLQNLRREAENFEKNQDDDHRCMQQEAHDHILNSKS